MVCWQTLRDAALTRLRLKLPPMTDEEVCDLLNAKTHEEVHERIQALTDEELLNVVMEAVRRKQRRRAGTQEKQEVAAYA
jgi:predicted house-cleaning noncanonical NTP pyrophosphatase (MazG superfamily)